MLDLFKEVLHPSNFRNSLIYGSYKIRTVSYSREAIAYLGPKFWSIIPGKIRESESLGTFRQKIRLWKIAVHVAFAKNILQMLASLIFHEFQ